MSCPNLNGCIFFNDKMPMETGLGAIYKRKYCLGNYEICARYKVAKALGKEKVPINLYPNQFDVAEKLLKENS